MLGRHLLSPLVPWPPCQTPRNPRAVGGTYRECWVMYRGRLGIGGLLPRPTNDARAPFARNQGANAPPGRARPPPGRARLRYLQKNGCRRGFTIKRPNSPSQRHPEVGRGPVTEIVKYVLSDQPRHLTAETSLSLSFQGRCSPLSLDSKPLYIGDIPTKTRFWIFVVNVTKLNLIELFTLKFRKFNPEFRFA